MTTPAPVIDHPAPHDIGNPHTLAGEHARHALVDQLLAPLRRHVKDEQEVLAALPAGVGDVRSVSDLAAADQAWLPHDGAAVVIELDNLPADLTPPGRK